MSQKTKKNTHKKIKLGQTKSKKTGKDPTMTPNQRKELATRVEQHRAKYGTLNKRKSILFKLFGFWL